MMNKIFIAFVLSVGLSGNVYSFGSFGAGNEKCIKFIEAYHEENYPSNSYIRYMYYIQGFLSGANAAFDHYNKKEIGYINHETFFSLVRSECNKNPSMLISHAIQKAMNLLR